MKRKHHIIIGIILGLIPLITTIIYGKGLATADCEGMVFYVYILLPITILSLMVCTVLGIFYKFQIFKKMIKQSILLSIIISFMFCAGISIISINGFNFIAIIEGVFFLFIFFTPILLFLGIISVTARKLIKK